MRWGVALALFFEPCDDFSPALRGEGMRFLADFIAGPGGVGDGAGAGAGAPRLLDWRQDAALIAADVNRVAGCEVRALPYLHWWTFLACFNAIGEGQLSTVVGIRDKLRRGKKLEPWEQEYYRAHKPQVDLKPRYPAAETAEQARLRAIMGA